MHPYRKNDLPQLVSPKGRRGVLKTTPTSPYTPSERNPGPEPATADSTALRALNHPPLRPELKLAYSVLEVEELLIS